MKKVMALLLVLVLSFTVCGCELGDILDALTGEEDPAVDVSGTVSGYTWENTFIGLGLTLDENWNFYTQEDLEKLTDRSELGELDDAQRELIRKATGLYDLYAINAPDSINVNLTKVSALESVILDLAESLDAQIPIIQEALNQAGYTDFQSEATTVTIDDMTFDAVKVTAAVEGVTLYQLSFMVQCDGYIANIAIATMEEDHTAALLDCFYVIEA